MSPLPMFPNWDGIHPLLIHFPVTLFVLGPIFAFVAAFTKAAVRHTLLVSCLVLMLLGTTSLQMSYGAGQAAARAASAMQAQVVLERHKEFADLARSSLTLATLLFGLTLLFCFRLDLRVRELIGVLPLGTAVFYGLGLFWLVHTAYEGERLVHEFGVGLITTH
jgi:uncharacterized membrane protein